MSNRWTRERIIRHILECEAEGRSLTTGRKGVDHRLYNAARRTFGSWRNAIVAAGIAPERVLSWERWSPAKILAKIRLISRRNRPLSVMEMDQRYGNVVSAARRHFGSWSKAVQAAGVDPTKLKRVVPWNRERVLEAILTRALRSEPLVARLVDPRSLVEAGHRFFGGWQSAVSAAGLDPRMTEMAPRRGQRTRPKRNPAQITATSVNRPGSWSKERVVRVIGLRVRDGKAVNAYAVSRDDSKLYSAARRCFGSWDIAMRAVGLEPAEYRRHRFSGPPPNRAQSVDGRKSQTDDGMRSVPNE